jgi:hypothetical protein
MTKTIEDILKDMPLDEAVKTRLKESWEAALADAKVAQESELRGDMEARYETDLEKIHEAFKIYLEQRLQPHVKELQEGVEAVEGMKTRYAQKTAKIKENAQTYVKRRLGAIEQVIEARIKAELSELHEDVVANRRAVLQTITEKRAELDAEKIKFRAKAAAVLENIINVKVPKQLEPLREDIIAARQDNFGREIFETFATMFRRQFFDTSTEFKKLTAQNAALAEQTAAVKQSAVKQIKESREKAAAATAAYSKLNESVTRQKAMTRLLKPLTGAPREQMRTLLEATKTEKLDATFRKALPQLVREARVPTAPAAKPGPRAVAKPRDMEFRGGPVRIDEANAYDPFDEEVQDIRRLAGNKK